MKKSFRKSMIFGFLIILLISNAAWGEKLNIQELNRAIERGGKGWVAAKTSKSNLAREYKRLLCRLKRREFTRSRQNKISEKAISEADPLKAKRFYEQKGAYTPGNSFFSGNPAEFLPSSFDWRNKDGYEWITSIRDQGQCGSCWAFASVSVMETMQKIGLEDVYLKADYSEQFMVSCSEGSCAGGWYLDNSAQFLKSAGAPKEECFPYQAQDLPCESRCTDWEGQITKIPDWNWVSGFPQKVNKSLIKRKLLKGPLLAAITVYEDFTHYSHGVYEHVQGDEIGGHAVVIVGWDDEDKSWICKNSWGTNWGDSGWFRIKMGQNECGIEQELIYYSSPIPWDCDREENFEDKANLPPGWERKAQNSSYSWKISDYPVYEGEHAICVEYDPDLSSQDEVLMSWEIKGSDLTVSFAFMGSYYWGVVKGNYQVSLWAVKGEWDGGADDDILITKNILKDHLQHDDESWIWFPVRYHLPPEADNSSIRLAFRYQGMDGAQFSLDKVCVQGIRESGCECILEDWGRLDIGQGSGNVPIRIQNAPNEVMSFGYDIVYDSNRVLYTGFELGDFFKDFNFCGCNEIKAGLIRCGGVNGEGENVPIGYSGTVLTLQFSPIALEAEGSGICLENLVDDMASWETTNGCLLPSACSFDVNGDGQVTPQDALCLYEKYLSLCPTSCGSCQEICCDVDMNGECTPSDALVVFREYLNGKINHNDSIRGQ